MVSHDYFSTFDPVNFNDDVTFVVCVRTGKLSYFYSDGENKIFVVDCKCLYYLHKTTKQY